ncbi:Ceramide_synthetase [Hexamita inflata]|uniref:Ceramide synthetase n=1 Tax=Hexamita inflata TaxID=28002 RepID=A0AA86VQ20_9EUKA|nr:Ceramide synthetase [Hexamita inflata]CAI9972973.1 Ceramide synthetase [Hexamita inflata]
MISYSIEIKAVYCIQLYKVQFPSKTCMVQPNNSPTSKVTFFLFGVSFIIPRCYVFPKFLIIPFYNGQLDDTLIKLDSNVDLLKAYSKLERTYIPAAFTVLFILNVIWTVAIVNMALKLLIKKEWRDVREKQVSKTD